MQETHISFFSLAHTIQTVYGYRKDKHYEKSRSVKHQQKNEFHGTANAPKIIPESVNYHFTRTCNYSCGFCFHTAKTSFNLPLEQAKFGLEMLVNEGMKKVIMKPSLTLK